jgi:hypothetical protein
MKEISAKEFIDTPRKDLNGKFKVQHIGVDGYNYLVASFIEGIFNGGVLSFNVEMKPIQAIFYNRGIIEGEFIDINYES